MLTAYTYRKASLVGNFVACGGFACLPVRFQICNHAAVTVPFRWPCRYIGYMRSAVHFASISGISYPPICFGRCSVDTGTRNTAPLQIYYVMAVVSCVYMFGPARFGRYTRFWTGEKCLHNASVLPGKGPECRLSLPALVPSLLIMLRSL